MLVAVVLTCKHCHRDGMTVYQRDNESIGCSGCLGEFFSTLSPVQRPWAMTFWNDFRWLFRRRV
jgi:hypothetical protein